MLHWLKFTTFALIVSSYLSHTVLGCYDDYGCGYNKCCMDGMCHEHRVCYGVDSTSNGSSILAGINDSSGSKALTAVVVIVVIVVVVVAKIVFWVAYCHCRYRRRVVLVGHNYTPFQNAQTTVVVSNNHTTSSFHSPQPPQQQHAYSCHPPPAHPQQQPGFAFNQHTAPV